MSCLPSFARIVSKLFVPVKDVSIDLTSEKPSFEGKPGEEFMFFGHKFFYRPNKVLEVGMDIASEYPVTDNIEYKDRVEMINNFKEKYSSLLHHTEILNNNDSLCVLDTILEDPNSDERLIEMVRQGPGTLLIEHHKDEIFKVDLGDMEKYAVRDGFIPYGGCLYFDETYNLISISYGNITSLNGDNNWNQFKFIFKSSLLVKLVIKVHASEYHLILGSIVPQTIFKLSDGNAIKELMLPFIYHNLESSAAAKTVLFGRGRFFDRLFAFTNESLDAFVKHNLDNYQYKSFVDHQHNLGIIDVDIINTPYYQDGSSMYQILLQYVVTIIDSKDDVDEFLTILSSISNIDRFKLVDIGDVHGFLANYIFSGTVNHEIIGNTILKWQYDPSETSSKLRKDVMIADVDTYEQTMLIACATVMGKVPMLMEDISYYFKNAAKCNIYMEHLIVPLNDLAIEIDKTNTRRKVPFYGAHPKRLESTFSQ